MLYRVFFCIIALFGSLSVSWANEYIDGLIEDFAIEVIPSDDTSYEYPTWAQPDPDLHHTSLSYRVQDVLPYAEDRSADAYLVYPKAGIVLPILTPSAADDARIAQGTPFDHYSYLENGGLHYIGESPSVSPHNMAIAAHSSYDAADQGRYKTIFQALTVTRAGDVVRYFEKNKSGLYDRYVYEVHESFETDPYNVSILDYKNDGKSYLTTYGCYPLGKNTDRWVNVAELASVDRNFGSTRRPVVMHAPIPQRVEVVPAQFHAAPEEVAVDSVAPVADEPDTTTVTTDDSLTSRVKRQIMSLSPREKVLVYAALLKARRNGECAVCDAIDVWSMFHLPNLWSVGQWLM